MGTKNSKSRVGPFVITIECLVDKPQAKQPVEAELRKALAELGLKDVLINYPNQ